MRVLFALPGLHRCDRGAETAFIAVAEELARTGNEVTLIGSGAQRDQAPYRFIHAGSVPRENFESLPSLPALRNDCSYEELTFVPDFMRRYRPAEFDVTVTCSYPFTNWMLRRPTLRGARPPHVFVTQNGDWPAYADNAEFRLFGCEGMVCTNPDFYARNKGRWRCQLIPNAVDCNRFCPGPAQRDMFGLPPERLVVLMVSALIPSKRVETAIEAVSLIPGAHLVVAGDGPLRQKVDGAAARLMPGRFTRLTAPPEKMPNLYRSADVFLHLSKEESFGNVFVEAMACGLPVVGHDSERLRWIVGRADYLLDTEDVAALAERVRRAGDESQLGRDERVGRAANFSASRIAAMYRDFFAEVIDAWGHGYRSCG
ncbi:MAG: glycosyltransferase family 4 protein [Xanthobacteraceae bacterium]